MVLIICPYCEEIVNHVIEPIERGRYGVICRYCRKEFLIFGKIRFTGFTYRTNECKMEDLDKLLQLDLSEEYRRTIEKIYKDWLSEQFIFEKFLR